MKFLLRSALLITVWATALGRRRQWHPTPVLLPGKYHRWRRLVGFRLWGRTESDTTEWLPFHFSLSRIGEGNGNPLQCSCLENPRDGGALWAAIYGVAQSWTRLKRLSNIKKVLWILKKISKAMSDTKKTVFFVRKTLSTPIFLLSFLLRRMIFTLTRIV